MLLTRDKFREGVFERDGHRCVAIIYPDLNTKTWSTQQLTPGKYLRADNIARCSNPAADAHHIIERRLFPDGGYYLDNGASLCEEHHILAEKTIISCDDLREWCGIKHVVLPPHLYKDQPYDKWGNPILPNGRRIPGDLFQDESVQKILADVCHLFDNHVKYPRTYHLPWSPGVGKDDRILSDLSGLEGKQVVVTVKMDGENTSMYSDYMHARSLDYDHHPSRSWVRALHAKIAHDIPEGWRVCGENLYAKHSIKYNNLEDYFLVFSIWDHKNICLSWDDTKEWVELLGLKTVPVLFEGQWDAKEIKNIKVSNHNDDEMEGYVVRVRDAFSYSQFRKVVGKYVRANHVQTHGHWMRSSLEINNRKN